MNSEANAPSLAPSTSVASFADPEEGRASRIYVRMGREASPLLPWISGGEADGVGVFDFGFGAEKEVAAGAEEEEGAEWRSALEEIDLGVVERKLEGALAGFEAEGDRRSEARASTGVEVPVHGLPRTSVWEDGEGFWEGREWRGFGARSAADFANQVVATPRKRRVGSIQMTPRSLYDSDGFLKT